MPSFRGRVPALGRDIQLFEISSVLETFEVADSPTLIAAGGCNEGSQGQHLLLMNRRTGGFAEMALDQGSEIAIGPVVGGRPPR